MDDLRDQIESMIATALRPLRSRIGGMITRGAVTLVNEALKMRGLQVSLMKDESADDLEHFEPYGFTARPKLGAEALVVNVGGLSDHGVVIMAADRRFRLMGLADGEVALYDDLGQQVKLGRTAITVMAATGNNINLNVSGAGKVMLAGGGSALCRGGDSVSLKTCSAGNTHSIAALVPASGEVVASGLHTEAGA